MISTGRLRVVGLAGLRVSGSTLCFAADLRRCGRVALSVLYEPKMSISITDLKALTESWLMDARKFPAAPALYE